MSKFAILLVVLYFGVLALTAPVPSIQFQQLEEFNELQVCDGENQNGNDDYLQKLDGIIPEEDTIEIQTSDEDLDPTLVDGLQFFQFFDSKSGSEITRWDCSKFNISICIQLKEQFQISVNQLKPVFESMFVSVEADNEDGVFVVLGGSLSISYIFGKTTDADNINNLLNDKDEDNNYDEQNLSQVDQEVNNFEVDLENQNGNKDDLLKLQYQIFPNEDAQIENIAIEDIKDTVDPIGSNEIQFFQFYDGNSESEFIGWDCSLSDISFATECIQLKERFQISINQLKAVFKSMFGRIIADENGVFILLGGSVRIGDEYNINNLLNNEKVEDNEILQDDQQMNNLEENNLIDQLIEERDDVDIKEEDDTIVQQKQFDDESSFLLG